jgi:hypothetical protein
VGNSRYEIAVVPPGGGETDYNIIVEQADHIPQPGEYLLMIDPNADDTGLAAFKVLYVTTAAKYVSEGHAVQDSVVVQAEVISHPHQGERHAAVVAMYRARAQHPSRKEPDEYPTSGY